MVKVEEYMNLAEWVARKVYVLYKKHYDLEDLVQEAYLGLLKASKKFDQNNGCKFSTYAYHAINGYIRNTIRDDRYRLGTREQRIDATHNLLLSYNSISNLESENKELSFLSMFGKEDIKFEETELKLDLQNSIQSNKDKKIVKLKLLGYTQKEIAKAIGVSQVTVSRALTRVGKRLKEVM